MVIKLLVCLRIPFFIDSDILHEGLNQLKLDDIFVETLLTLHHNVGTKRGRMEENSSILWHKRLGHIFRERLEKLIKDRILSNLDFTDFGICVY